MLSIYYPAAARCENFRFKENLMKNLSFIFSLLFATSTLANSSHVNPAPEAFVCGDMSLHADTIRLQVGGPRYGDDIYLQLQPAELKQLLPPSEQNKTTDSESISGFLSRGSCKLGTSPDVVVSCVIDQWSGLMNLNFSTWEALAPGFGETLVISRNIAPREFNLQVLKVGTDAKLQLTMKVDTATAQGVSLKIERILGSLENEWFSCRFR